jgi:hypothetical protein
MTVTAPILLLLTIAALADRSYTLAFLLFMLTGFRALTS